MLVPVYQLIIKTSLETRKNGAGKRMLVPQSFKWIDFRKPKIFDCNPQQHDLSGFIFYLFLFYTSLHLSSVVGRDRNVAFGRLALVLTLVKRRHAALGLGVAATIEIAADIVPETEVVERLINVSRFLVVDAHVEIETVSGRVQTTHGSQNNLLRLQVGLQYTPKYNQTFSRMFTICFTRCTQRTYSHCLALWPANRQRLAVT
jgi:hypothetical protein